MDEKKGRDDRAKEEEALDRFVEMLQRNIIEEEERLYSEQVRSEASAPSNMGKLDEPDATGVFTGPCGDTMVLDIKLKGGIVSQIRFRTDGCGATLACGSMVTKMVGGLTVEQARALTSDQLEQRLGGLPDENKHCAVLAIRSLKKALDIFEGKDGNGNDGSP
jgi:nitrogen fixation NifU-like protein